MTIHRLRSRLDRLTPTVSNLLGQDRGRDRRRRDELSCRKRASAQLTEREEAELSHLNAFFHDEDRDRARLLALVLRQLSAKRLGNRLTDVEARELSELQRRFPPDPNHRLKDAVEAWRRARQRAQAER